MDTIDVEMQRTQTVPAVWVQDATKADNDTNPNLIYNQNASDISQDVGSYSDTIRFIEKLCGDSLTTFQTFDDVVLEDGKRRKDPTLSKIKHGKFEDIVDELSRLNEKGAGISHGERR